MHWSVYNALQHGVPQNRPRLWAIGLRKDTPGVEQGLQGLDPLPAGLCLTLDQILDRRGEGDDADNMPMGQVAATNVRKAKEEAERRGQEVDWMVTQQVGRGWSASVRPRMVMPCLLHSNKGGYWIGSRGRAARVAEHSRAQGLPAAEVRWPKDSAAYALLGNSMARPLLQRFIHKILRTWGLVEGPDPWELGDAQFVITAKAEGASGDGTYGKASSIGKAEAGGAGTIANPALWAGGR